MVSELVAAVILLLLVLAFYRLFERADQYLAVWVVILGGVMPAVIYFDNVVTDAGALMVVRGADFLSVFDKPQRDALVMLFLRLHDHQFTATLLLAGAWLSLGRWFSCYGSSSKNAGDSNERCRKDHEQQKAVQGAEA